MQCDATITDGIDAIDIGDTTSQNHSALLNTAA